MKKIKLIVLSALLLFSAAACKKDKIKPDKPADENEQISMVGKWNIDRAVVLEIIDGEVNEIINREDVGWFQFNEDQTGSSYIEGMEGEDAVETNFTWIQTEEEIILSPVDPEHAGQPDIVLEIVTMHEEEVLLRSTNEFESDGSTYVIQVEWLLTPIK